MVRGSNKQRSIDHENFIARLFGGIRQKGSGATPRENGDVRIVNSNSIFECKCTGEPGKPKRTTLIKQFEKVANEAHSEGRTPAIALRFFVPDSPLANKDGWVDLVVRQAGEDAEREDAWLAQQVAWDEAEEKGRNFNEWLNEIKIR